jgi:hypothetical protein
MLIAHMECSRVFDDAGLAEWRALLEPRPATAHTVRTMPDLCVAALHVGLWRDPAEDGVLDAAGVHWAKLLTRALPNPCKGRAISDDLATDVVQRPAVYDCVLRVLFGGFLGVYPGDAPLAFSARIACYAAFALHPPTPEQLATFIRRRKLVTTFCFHAYLLFLLQQTPMHDLLCARYAWEQVVAHVRAGMDAFRAALPALITDAAFLAAPDHAWLGIDLALAGVNKAFKRFVFRGATEPFYKRALADLDDIERLEIKARAARPGLRVTALPVPQLCVEDVRYCLDFGHGQLVGPALVEALTDVVRWGGVAEFPEVEAAYTRAREQYRCEIKMTGAQRLLYGTRSKPTGLFRTNRVAFDRIADFLRACNVRLRVRWGYLPRPWLEAQEAALRRRLALPPDAELPPDAARYHVCPQCAAVRSRPAEWPEGRQAPVRSAAAYPREICLDLDTMAHYCSTPANARRKGAIMRRRSRNARKGRREPKNAAGDDIEVCDGTRVLPVAMAGIALVTEADGLLVLCVGCACLLHFTPQCLTPAGPSCGCLGAPPDVETAVVECAVCDTRVPADTTRRHRVLGEERVVDVDVCRRHFTRWADHAEYMFPLAVLRQVVADDLRVRFADDATPYLHRRRRPPTAPPRLNWHPK